MSTATDRPHALPGPLLDEDAAHIAPLGRRSPPQQPPDQQSARPAETQPRRRWLTVNGRAIALAGAPIVAAIVVVISTGGSPAPPAPLSTLASAALERMSGSIAQTLRGAAIERAAAQRVAERKLLAERRARARRRVAQRRRAAARRRAVARRVAARRRSVRQAMPRRSVTPAPRPAPRRAVTPAPRPGPEFPF